MQKILISIFVTFLLVSCFWNDEVKSKEPKLNLNNLWNTSTWNTSTWTTKTSSWIVKNESVSKIPEASWLEKAIEEFNVNYKKALLSTWEWNQISIWLTKNITEQWWAIISNYRWYNVKWFEKTLDLDNKLIAIGINLLNASDYVTSGKMDLAHQELEKVGVVVSKIREENGIKSIREDMQTVQDKIEEIISDPENKDTKKFEALSSWIQKLSEYNADNKEYKKMLWDFEKMVINVSNLSWKEYKTKLTELKESFKKMYLKFG